MKQKVVTLVLLAGCVVLGAAAFFVSGTKDKKAPEITVSESEVSYVTGESYDTLLEGVTAMDNKDGDLTDEIFIDRIVPMTGSDKAIVYYAVTDKSNNVGTAKRIVKYYNNSEDAKNAAAAKPEETKPEPAADADQTTDEGTPEGDAQQVSQGVYPADPIDVSAGKPVVQVKQQEVTATLGETVNLMEYINTIADADTSNENYNYMFSHVSITVDGVQSTSMLTLGEARVYEVAYFAGNRNGAVSDPTVMRITVQ